MHDAPPVVALFGEVQAVLRAKDHPVSLPEGRPGIAANICQERAEMRAALCQSVAVRNLPVEFNAIRGVLSANRRNGCGRQNEYKGKGVSWGLD